MPHSWLAAAGALLILGSATAGAQQLDQLRGPAPLTEEADPPRMAPVENRDLRRARNYPEQPPTIPHTIEGYQIDVNANRCLACHSRAATGQSQAPMVSITHFMDRDGQFLAAVSPRRYFCNQCHVPQHEVEPVVGNDFVDIDTILTREAEQQN
jgi:nitrate reductase (cytochrome), electron transfer subunit